MVYNYQPDLAKDNPSFKVRPWVRFWACVLDYWIAGIIFGIVIGFLKPNLLKMLHKEPGISFWFGIVGIFVWVFIEPLFLSFIGTTPGKWLFKIRLVPPIGERPDYITALSRSFKVWVRELGMGLPFISLITYLISYNDLTKKGVTSWDRDLGFTVIHYHIGPLRVFIIIVLFIFLGLLIKN